MCVHLSKWVREDILAGDTEVGEARPGHASQEEGSVVLGSDSSSAGWGGVEAWLPVEQWPHKAQQQAVLGVQVTLKGRQS